MKRALLLSLLVSLAALLGALVWFTSTSRDMERATGGGAQRGVGSAHTVADGGDSRRTGASSSGEAAATRDATASADATPRSTADTPHSDAPISGSPRAAGSSERAGRASADETRRAVGASGETATIQSLSGRVMGSAAPLRGAELVLTRADGDELARVRSDASGQFFISLSDALDNATLLVRASGYAPLLRAGERVQRGERRNLGLLRLEPGLAVRGVVVDAAGNALSGARVVLRGPSLSGLVNRALSETATDRDGRFVFEDAPAAQLRIEAFARGHGARALDPVHPPTDALRIPLSSEHVLHARVVDRKSGAGVAAARIELAALDTLAASASATTDADGHATLDGLGAEEWALKIQAPRYRVRSEQRISIDERERVLELEPWPCVRGVVRTPAGGERPAEIVVRVRPTAGGQPTDAAPRASGIAAPDGAFELCDLRPGLYVVEAQAAGFAAVRSGELQIRLDREAEPLELVLSNGSALAVRVATSGATPVDAVVEAYSTPPAESELLQAAFDAPTASGTRIAHAAADPSGVATLEHLPNGRVWIVARAREHLAELRGPYTLDERETRPPLEFELARGARIVGRVVRDGGVPVAGALVILRRTSTAGQAALRANTDDSGAFASPLLPPGTWKLVARAGQAGSSADHGERSNEVTLDASAERENRVELVLR